MNPVELKDLEVGDIVYEREYGFMDQYRVVSAPRRIVDSEDYADGWLVEVQPLDDSSGPIEFFVSDEYAHLGPELYI